MVQRKQDDKEKKNSSRKNRRRTRGFGTVYQRSDGRWAADFLVEATGMRKTLYARTKQEAEAKLQQAMIDQKQGILATGPRQTVKQYLEDWLENMHGPTLEDSSLKTYQYMLRKHIIPAIGHFQLQKLATQQVQALYAQKMKEGYAPETIHSIHKILHRAFDDAVRWKLMPYNVCGRGKVTLPRIELQDIHPLDKEQAQALLEAVKGHWYLEALLTLAVATGMRRGELLALKWDDVDFQEGCLYVRQGLRRKKGEGLVVSRPKTERSKRQIFLPEFVMEVLQIHRERQNQMGIHADQGKKEVHNVFSDERGGFIDPVRFHRHFKKVLKLAGLPDMRIHDLRHTAATLLLKMGVHPKLVQELLGHSDIRTTLNRYSHVLPSMQREMMDNFHQFFEGS